jgi:hypothetical protein
MSIKKRGDYVRDAKDVIDPATDLVRIKEVQDKANELVSCQIAIEKMCTRGVVWLLGLINANGWTNIEAAKALGLNVNRVGALTTGKSDILTENETSLMLRMMLLIDVDESLTPIEISATEGKSKLHKVS